MKKLTITENFQDKLHQEECKESKGAKICASIRTKLECQKCSKTFCKIFAGQKMQNIPLTLRTFLNQLKAF